MLYIFSIQIYIDVNDRIQDHLAQFEDSAMWRLIDRHQNTVRLLITLPSATEIIKFKERESSRHILNKENGLWICYTVVLMRRPLVAA